MAQAREIISDSVEDIRGTFGEVVQTAGNVASKVGSEVKKGAVEIGSAVKDASRQAAQQMGHTGEHVSEVVAEKVHQATDKLDETVRQAPLLSLVAAFGLGAVVALLCRRSA